VHIKKILSFNRIKLFPIPKKLFFVEIITKKKAKFLILNRKIFKTKLRQKIPIVNILPKLYK
jgi:hypothetical protein